MSEDLPALYEVYADEEGARWVGDGTPISVEECKQWLDVTKKNYLERGYGMFALDEKATDRTIGFCGLVHPAGQIEPEVKYAFLRAYWNQGFASEAVPHLLSYGAQEHKLTEIIATVAAQNAASQRVLVKAGMSYSHTYAETDGSQTQLYRWRAS